MVRIGCPGFDSPFPLSLLELSVMKKYIYFPLFIYLIPLPYNIRCVFWNRSFILTESAISSSWPYPGLTIDLILCNPSFFEKYPFLYSVYKTAAMIISKVITTKTTTTIVVVLLSPSGVLEVVGLMPLVVVNCVECWAKNISILQSFVRSKCVVYFIYIYIYIMQTSILTWGTFGIRGSLVTWSSSSSARRSRCRWCRNPWLTWSKTKLGRSFNLLKLLASIWTRCEY